MKKIVKLFWIIGLVVFLGFASCDEPQLPMLTGAIYINGNPQVGQTLIADTSYLNVNANIFNQGTLIGMRSRRIR
jgi:hypothetical protein